MGRGWLRRGSTLGVVVLACGCELLAGITDKRIGDAAGGGGESSTSMSTSTSTSTHATVTTRSSSASSGLGGGTGGMAGPGGATGAGGLAGSGGNATAGGAAPSTGVGGGGAPLTSSSVGGGGAAATTVATTSTSSSSSTASSSSSGAGGSVPWTCSVTDTVPATVNNIIGQPAVAYDPATQTWGVAGCDSSQHQILYNGINLVTEALACATDCAVAPTTPNFTYSISASMALAGTHFAISYGVDTGSGTLNGYTEVELVTPFPFSEGAPGQSTPVTATSPPESDGIAAFNDPSGGALMLITVARATPGRASSATIAHRFDARPKWVNSTPLAGLPTSYAASVAWSPSLQLVAVPFLPTSGPIAADVQYFTKTLAPSTGPTAFTVAADQPYRGAQGEGVAIAGASDRFGVAWANGLPPTLDTRVVGIDGAAGRVPNTFAEADVAGNDARSPALVDDGTSYGVAWLAYVGATYHVRFRRFDAASLDPLEAAPIEVVLNPQGFPPSIAIAAGPKNRYAIVYRPSGSSALKLAEISCTGPP